MAFYSLGEILGVELPKKKRDDFFKIVRYANAGIWFEQFYHVFPNPHKVAMSEVGKTQDVFALPIFELHCDGGPSVELLDLKSYHWHNIEIPEKYGAVKSKDWKPEWFAEEENVELKRILAEEIGYERIFATLNAKKVDTYREYTLYRAENVDVEPLVILQMRCPSTGKTHYGRVSPDIKSAKLAAAVYNFGIPASAFCAEA